MRTKLPSRLLLSALCLLTSAPGLPAFAQDSPINYQGRLLENGSPASGAYEPRFTLYDSTHNPVIQGLNEKVEIGSQKSEVRCQKLEVRLEQKEAEIEELRKALADLRKMVGDLALTPIED